MTFLTIVAPVHGGDPCNSLSASSASSQQCHGNMSSGRESPERFFAGRSLVSPGQQPREQMDRLFQGQPRSIPLG